MSNLLVGLDLGSTLFKAVACDLAGHEVSIAARSTPWIRGDEGLTMSSRAAQAALDAAVAECLDRAGEGQVLGVGVTGMAEAGFLVEPSGAVLNNAYAWSEPHGAQQARQLRQHLGGEAFAARTGLPISTRCTAVKARWMTSTRRYPSRGVRWENLPEWYARQLSETSVAELSLAARTGLLDLRKGEWDPELAAWAGVDLASMPTLQAAGTSMGPAIHGDPRLAGAMVTVAGHDHVCATVGAGAAGVSTAFDSLGTGEAVIRTIAPPSDEQQMVRAVQSGLTVGLHVAPASCVLMAGLGMGRRLKRVLAALEVQSSDRAAFDTLALDSAPEPVTAWLEAVLLGNSDTAQTEMPPGTHRPGSWHTAVRMSAEECRAALATLASLAGGEHDRLVAAGGWFRSQPLTAMREEILGTIDVPLVEEATGRGAALIAGVAASVFPSIDHLPLPPLARERSA